MSDSVVEKSIQPGSKDAARIVWFLGPRPTSWNGVMRYSLECIDMMSEFSGFNIEAIDIPAEPRSFRRYWTQFVLFPLRAVLAARSSNLVVLYQEDLAFMIPVIRCAGGRVGIVLHHVQHPARVRGFVEKLKNLYIRLTQPLIAKADLVISPSDVTAHEACSDIHVQADRVQVVPNAFDDRYAPVDMLVRAQARAMLLARFDVSIGDELVLLNVGSDETRKNNVAIFRALEKLGRKDIMVLRVGNAQNSANHLECKEISEKAGINAHFIENVSDEDLGYFYQAADLYVSPTLQEGFGRTVIEAQIVGVPVVASDLPVYRHTMGDSFMAVCDAKDATAWGEHIERLANDPCLRARLVRDGRKNAQRFSSRSVRSLLHGALDRAVRK